MAPAVRRVDPAPRDSLGGAAGSGQPRRRARRLSAHIADDVRSYGFLVGTLVDTRTLRRAAHVARRWHTAPHDALIALAWVTRERYAATLAAHLGVAHVVDPAAAPDCTVVAATAYRPDEIAHIVAFEAALGRTVALSSEPGTSGRLGPQPSTEEAIAEAAEGLRRRRPEWSAAMPLLVWQRITLICGVVVLLGGALLRPEAMLAILFALITVPFTLVTALRLMAVCHLLASPRAERSGREHLPDHALPVYSVLVPLYREPEVIPGLLRGLSALDWPPDRLDIIIVLEADDLETRVRIAAESLPSTVTVLLTPPGQPRTKPRAVNFAMAYARGDFVVVLDAEDAPEPDQLRRAYAVLRRDPEHIGCVQARLHIYNPFASWLSAQFAIEYAALYDGLLPTLQRYDLPMPLGGTSNHFPRRLIEALGGWDPYNVTEDADLGLRLSRRGWRVAMIGSVTWEEAPSTYRNWRNQRTRWLKGWMQTMLVHTRRPVRLIAELGEVRFLGLVAFLGGLILAALVHPWFYVLLGVAIWQEQWLELPASVLGQSLWGLAAFNLLAGYAAAMLLGVVAAQRRGYRRLARSVLLLPFYWLAISLAAYRALWQLARDPYRWEKTAHKGHPPQLWPPVSR